MLFVTFPNVSTLNKDWIELNDNPHFKIAPLDYICLGKTGRQSLITTLCFCLKVGASKISECELDLWP